jgi:hypothetical protein
MTPYDWTCLACGASNSKGVSSCADCGCPSRSTVKQQEHFRREWQRATEKPVLVEQVLVPLSSELLAALSEIRRRVISRLITGAALAILIAGAVYFRYANLVATRFGIELVGSVVLGILFFPAANYLASLKCPRCHVAWRPAKYSRKEHGWYTSWIVWNWKQCGHCGLSVPGSEQERSGGMAPLED